MSETAVIDVMKARKDVKGLIRVLRHANDPDLQSAAGTALVNVGEIRDPGSVEELLAALNDRDGDVREIAAVAFHQVNDPRAVEPLIHVVKDSNQIWFLRWRAASRLGEIRDRRAIAPLTAALQDQEAQFARAARGALVRMGELQPARSSIRPQKRKWWQFWK